MYNKPEFEIMELGEEDVILTSIPGLEESEEIPEFPGEVEFG